MRECVASGNRTRIQASIKPVHALLGRTMRKGFRLYVSSSHLLDVVIADRRGRAQCGLHIARIDQAALLRGMCPHPSQAIGLQFQFH